MIHMPERNFREWNYKAIELILAGLKQRGLKATTVSQLSRTQCKGLVVFF